MVNKIEYIPWIRQTFPMGCYIRSKKTHLIQKLQCQEYEPFCIILNDNFEYVAADWNLLFNDYEHVIGLNSANLIMLTICGDKVQYVE